MAKPSMLTVSSPQVLKSSSLTIQMSEQADHLLIPGNESNPFIVAGELHQGLGAALPKPRSLTAQETETIKKTASLLQEISLESLNEAKTKGFELAFLLNKALSKQDIDPTNAKIFIDDLLRGAETVLAVRDPAAAAGDGTRVPLLEKAVAQCWDVRDWEEEELEMHHMCKEEAFRESEKYMSLCRFAETATGLVKVRGKGVSAHTTEDVRAVALGLGEQVAVCLQGVPFFALERFVGTVWCSGHRLVGYRAHANGVKAREAANPRESGAMGFFTKWGAGAGVSPDGSGRPVARDSDGPFDLFRWAEEI